MTPSDPPPMSLPPQHPTPDAIWVREPGDVGAARRRTRALAAGSASLDPDAVALVATELATNLVEHAGGGFLAAFRDGDALELISVDEGGATWGRGRPGLGAGLPTVRAHATTVEIDRGERGAVVRARFGPNGTPARAAFVVPTEGCYVAGDGVRFDAGADDWVAVVVDALGHGPGASADRDVALETLATVDVRDPRAVFSALDAALRGRRGAAMRWAHARGGEVRTFGVGNVEGGIVDRGGVTLFDSQPGIIGRVSRDPEVRVHALGPRARVTLHTDGLTTASRHEAGNLAGSAVMDAAKRLRDFRRQRDDAAVVVVGGA